MASISPPTGSDLLADLGDVEAVLFNPFLPEVRADPYPHYHQLRANDPVGGNPFGFWILTRHADSAALSRNCCVMTVRCR